MKRRLIICSSLITIILSCFSFPIFAEETVQDSSNLHSLSDGVFLDQYFYDNYDLLPYLESNGNQYIDTGIYASNNLKTSITLSDISIGNALFGTRGSDAYSVLANLQDEYVRFIIMQSGESVPYKYYNFNIFDIVIDQYNSYINGVLVHHFTENPYSGSTSIYLFGRNNSNVVSQTSAFKLYKFSIYDYSANNGEGAFIRYYYPAKAKSSGILGLYDAVSKTFVSSFSSDPFTNPTNEYVENFQISSFLSSSLGWIGQIFTAIIDMPIVIIFMAIGLAGAMFRWGRRIVHF